MALPSWRVAAAWAAPASDQLLDIGQAAQVLIEHRYLDAPQRPESDMRDRMIDHRLAQRRP